LDNTPIEVHVDIETLDTAPTAIVLSIGVVVARGGEILREQLVYPSLTEQVKLGRTSSSSTVSFWLQQPREAFDASFVPERNRISIAEAKELLDETVFNPEPEAIWANGDLFDLGILQDLFGVGLWQYNKPRDLRTVIKEAQLHGLDFDWPSEEGLIAHHPVDDCKRQLRTLMSVRGAWGAATYALNQQKDCKYEGPCGYRGPRHNAGSLVQVEGLIKFVGPERNDPGGFDVVTRQDDGAEFDLNKFGEILRDRLKEKFPNVEVVYVGEAQTPMSLKFPPFAAMPKELAKFDYAALARPCGFTRLIDASEFPGMFPGLDKLFDTLEPFDMFGEVSYETLVDMDLDRKEELDPRESLIKRVLRKATASITALTWLKGFAEQMTLDVAKPIDQREFRQVEVEAVRNADDSVIGYDVTIRMEPAEVPRLG
jgi:hypothetical protein